MYYTSPFQKHLCVVFLSLALFVSYISLKKRLNRPTNHLEVMLDNNSSTPSQSKPNPELFNYQNFSIYNNYLNENKTKIYILGLFELTTKWGKRTHGFSEMLAAKLAVEHINSLNILPEYNLEMLVNDTQCDPGVGIDTFFHAIYSNKTILMLLGTSCSNVTESLAHVVPYWNILQISSGSTSPSLSDRNKFPLFFRTIAADSSHNLAKIYFINHFHWKVVATFSQSENKFLLPLNKLITDLEKANVSCIGTVTFSLDNYKEQLRTLKDFDVRIIIGSFSSEIAPKIFCEAFKLGIYGGEYVWILQYQRKSWWQTTKECDTFEWNQSTQGIILVSDYQNITDTDTATISGLSYEFFQQILNVSKSEISPYASLTYDAVWSMALTLKNSHIYDWDFNYLQSFNYQRKDMVCEFVEKMNILRFMGLSGPVKFFKGDRIGNSLLQQIQNGKLHDIAVFDSVKNELNFNCKFCYKIQWPHNQIPVAKRILKVNLIKIPQVIFYSIVSFSVLGILMSLIFFYFNLHFRRVKTVKLSSPKLSNVAVIGCILVYLSIIILGVDKYTFDIHKYFNELCTTGVYLLSAGFSLAFGSMFAKTYRVHRIFSNYGTGGNRGKLLKDKQLIGLILIPLIIDAVILTLWITIDPMQRQLFNLTLEISSSDPGIVYQPQVEVCRSQNTNGWLIAMYGYKGLILIMGVFMAWETRHIKVQALNDSQYISISVYSAVFSAIIVILSSLVSEYVIISYLARTISILASATITLSLLFLPKLKSVFDQVNCEDPIMQSMGLKIEYNTRRFIIDDPKEQIYRLEIQNKVYKCELKALEMEIKRLEELISPSSNSSLSSNVIEVYTLNRGDYLNVHNPNLGRASWPTACENLLKSHKNLFCSDEILFGKLKWIFDNKKDLLHINCSEVEGKHRSNPEFYSHVLIPKKRDLIKAKSDIIVDDTPDTFLSQI